MNKLYLIGNLTSDPELRTTPNGINVCTMNVAVNRRTSSQNSERQTEYFRVTVWRQLGEICARFLSKGKKVAVIGEVSARAYILKDGTARASLEVTADEVEFLSPRDQTGYQQNNQGYQSNQGYRPNYPQQDSQTDNQNAHHNGYAASRQNGWQESRAASENDSFAGTAFNPTDDDMSDGFTEISDSELPF